MRRLKDSIRVRVRDLKGEESGISLLFVTISLVVLIGMVAFAVDIGALYQERRELQNGADAAAIAIAEDCARAPATCIQVNADATADTYADFNAADAASAVDSVTLDAIGKTVDVAVSTETTSGGSIFRPFFANVVGFDGTTVHADASAAWGFPSGISTLPLIISQCEWDREAGGGASLWPDDPLPPVGTPSLLKFHTGPGGGGGGGGYTPADDCAAQAGQDWDGDTRMPGGFGWLDAGSNCEADVDLGEWVDTKPGVPPPMSCDPDVWEIEILNKLVFIPWFDDLRNPGANGEFHIAGFGAFFVTGYNFGGQYKEPSPEPCTGAERCLEGFFVETTLTYGDLGGEDFGTLIIKFTE